MPVRGSDGASRERRARRSAGSREPAGRRPVRAPRPTPDDEPDSRQPDTHQRDSRQHAERPARRRRRPGLFGLAPTRRAAVLAIVACALVLSVAVPLRTYLSQRDDVRIQEQRQAELRAQVQELQQRKAQLSDDAQVEAEARRRLRYVKPGETPYVVQLPGDGGGAKPDKLAATPPPAGSWYDRLWDSVSGG